MPDYPQRLFQLPLDADSQQGRIAADTRVFTARQSDGRKRRLRPRQSKKWPLPSPNTALPVVFAPHVETASGIMLPDDYIQALLKPCTPWAAYSLIRLHRLGLHLA